MKKKIFILCGAILLLFFFVLNLKAEDLQESQKYLTIKVDFKKIRLIVYDEAYNEIASYPVCLPKETPKLPATGRLIRVEINPIWYPTEKIKDKYRSHEKIELPDIVPPGSPLNAMGAVKIVIDFSTGHIEPTVRIHGTNKPRSIGKRESSGCIRMLNAQIKEVASLIKGKKIIIIFC